ncbi:hypothetical protein R3P38DRAFT_3167664 [Favolaschia claudopus]|uniref:Uncharacterized protein n=1 Tax=Favolaschia claudopus TaxID=2862362 RepID=A0AAW0E5D7_9AGAR
MDDFNDIQMIADTINDSPQAAMKFLVTTPSIVAKQKSKKPGKRKKKEDSEDDEAETSSQPRKKPKAKRSPKDEDNDTVSDGEEPPPPSIAVYISIPKNPAPVVKGRKNKANDDDFVKKGPFTLLCTDKYSVFLSKLAQSLPCLPAHINQNKITWKAVKPQSSQILPLGFDDGYKFMVKGMAKRREEDRMVLLMLPPPAQPMEEDVPWATGDADDVKPVRFDFSELERGSASDAIQQQQLAFNKATKTERATLEDTYPIGNFPAIDRNKGIYYDNDTKFYFELTPTRLGIWASAMAQKTTDEKRHPANSRFFDADQRIKNIGNHASAPASNAPPVPTPAAAAVPTPTTSLTDVLLAALLANGSLGALLGSSNNAATLSTAPAAPPPQPSSPKRTHPPSPVKRHTVSLDNFCDMYDIDAATCALLAEVGFRPGDVTEFEPDEALKQAGFTIFGWRRVHNANLRFKAALAEGTFNTEA